MKNRKKILGLLLTFALLFGLTACADSVSEPPIEATSRYTEESPEQTAAVSEAEDYASSECSEEAQEQTQPVEQTAAAGTLVIYFSRTGEQYNVGVIDKGNTAIVAEMIAEQPAQICSKCCRQTTAIP